MDDMPVGLLASGVAIQYIRRGNPTTMPASRASTAASAMWQWTSLCSPAGMMPARLRTGGWSKTTNCDHTTLWAIKRPARHADNPPGVPVLNSGPGGSACADTARGGGGHPLEASHEPADPAGRKSDTEVSDGLGG